MAEILSTISIVSFVLAAVFFVLAVVFWIRFGVLGIIGDLSGRTAKKSIAKMRENNKKTGKKLFRTSSIKVELEKLEDTRKKPIKIYEKTSKLESGDNLETGLLDDNKADNSTANSTELLDDNDATGVLNEEGTAVLDDNANTVFNEKVVDHSPKVANVDEIKIIDEVILIHTNEVI
ncbi:hypothetical protein [Clostridium fungisolvens]|uniref:Uncharacterized protein n=1 Tax=Clostridium fungisolvens TaxID=1604897 RepID=A0A6V8SAX5_9CLOT|nr:hypothetical protein [Clostridium fungisolvens]GFP74230.1 hypothetical protein bsdtw1_00275 [Clostridium fungisolvens]